MKIFRRTKSGDTSTPLAGVATKDTRPRLPRKSCGVVDPESASFELMYGRSFDRSSDL